MIRGGQKAIDVADRADDQAFLMAEFGELAADRARRIDRRLGRLVGDEFQRPDQPDAARFADKRMVGETLQPRLELRRRSGARAPTRSRSSKMSRFSSATAVATGWPLAVKPWAKTPILSELSASV